MKSPVLFVAAEPRECRNWVRRWENVRSLPLPVHWARAGKWRDRDMIAVANGAGWTRAAAAVKAVPHAAAVYNIGYCGALDASLRIGDVVTATEIRGPEANFTTRLPAGPAAKRGILLSVSSIVQTAEEKRMLGNSGAFIVEMEAAGVVRASEALGVPFYCVRAVSDLADEDFANNFNDCFTPDGRISLSRLLAGAIKSPVKRFGELIRLSGRASAASKNLGEFLANCTY